jgi:hypothetical protein
MSLRSVNGYAAPKNWAVHGTMVHGWYQFSGPEGEGGSPVQWKSWFILVALFDFDGMQERQ